MSSVAGEQQHHVMPLQLYLGIYGALLVLTAMTVGVSYLGLGQGAIYAAMAIAVVKAGLVVGFFMHLRYERRFLSLAFFGSLVFLALFFFFTFADLTTRDALVREQANFSAAKPAPVHVSPAGEAKAGGHH